MKEFVFTFFGILLTAFAASADPCAGVDRTLPAARKAYLDGLVQKAIKAPQAEVTDIMRFKNWTLINVSPHDSDRGFLFYDQDPAKSHFVTTWGGWARPDEERSIRDWAFQNAPGIPDELAVCFAWYVSHSD